MFVIAFVLMDKKVDLRLLFEFLMEISNQLEKEKDLENNFIVIQNFIRENMYKSFSTQQAL